MSAREIPRSRYSLGMTILTGSSVLVVALDVSPADRKLPAIFKGNRRASHQMRAIPGAKTFSREHVARLDAIFPPSLPVQDIRRTALKRPVHHFAAGVFHVQI